MTGTTPIAEMENGTVYYYDDRDAEKPTRHEGKVEIYDHWVKLGAPAVWVPRELVEGVHQV